MTDLSNIKEMDIEVIENALVSMAEDDRERIEMIAFNLMNTMKERIKLTRVDGKAMFGRKQAMEILAKLGVFMVRNDWDGKND